MSELSDERRAELREWVERVCVTCADLVDGCPNSICQQKKAELLALLDAPPAPTAIGIENPAIRLGDPGSGFFDPPKPPAPPLPERVKQLMVEVCTWQTTRDLKKYPWTDEDKKAFGEVLRILEHCGKTAPKVVSRDFIFELCERIYWAPDIASRKTILAQVFRDFGIAVEPEEEGKK